MEINSLKLAEEHVPIDPETPLTYPKQQKDFFERHFPTFQFVLATVLYKQYVLPLINHEVGTTRINIMIHPVTVYCHRANQ